jgi:hypothetical protein
MLQEFGDLPHSQRCGSPQMMSVRSAFFPKQSVSRSARSAEAPQWRIKYLIFQDHPMSGYCSSVCLEFESWTHKGFRWLAHNIIVV